LRFGIATQTQVGQQRAGAEPEGHAGAQELTAIDAGRDGSARGLVRFLCHVDSPRFR
jgi:hypothetical protein